jgi:hypothetical protein
VAVAIVVVTAVRGAVARATVTSLIVAAMVPAFLAERAPLAKGSDLAEVADRVRAIAVPGEPVLFVDSDIPGDVARLPSLLTLTAPDLAARLVDPGVVVSRLDASTLFDVRQPPAAAVSHLALAARVVVLRGADAASETAVATDSALAAAGYRLLTSESLAFTTIEQWERQGD